jgi:hypothetical protein
MYGGRIVETGVLQRRRARAEPSLHARAVVLDRASAASAASGSKRSPARRRGSIVCREAAPSRRVAPSPFRRVGQGEIPLTTLGALHDVRCLRAADQAAAAVPA